MSPSSFIRSVPVVTLLTLGIVACDSSVVIEDGGGGSGAGESGGSGAGVDGGGDTGGSCNGYEDQAGAASVTIRFRNDDFQPLYLEGTCSNVAFQLVPSLGGNASYPFDASCLQTCEDLQTEDQFACGACAPLMYRVEPGEELEVVWDGTGLASANMPSECFFSDFAGPLCSTIVAAPADNYAVNVMAYADCGDDCTCDDATGQCYGFPTGTGQPSLPASVSFPSASVVEVSWAQCTFGCPL